MRTTFARAPASPYAGWTRRRCMLLIPGNTRSRSTNVATLRVALGATGTKSPRCYSRAWPLFPRSSPTTMSRCPEP